MSKRLDNFVVDKATGKKQIFWVGHTAYKGLNAFKTCSDLGHIGNELIKRGIECHDRHVIFEKLKSDLAKKRWSYVTHQTNGMYNPATGKWPQNGVIEIKVDLDYYRHHNL